MGKDRLIVLNREKSKLPYELPPNLVYWIKCETRFKEAALARVREKNTSIERNTDAEEEISMAPVITEQELHQFYKTRVTLIEKFNAKKISKESNGSEMPPSIGACCTEKDLEMMNLGLQKIDKVMFQDKS
jgi:hypothetical protein